MSANAKNNAPAVTVVETEEKVLPKQKADETGGTAVLNARSVMADTVKAVQEKPGLVMSVTVSVDENDELVIQVDEVAETKVKSLAGKAKGVFQRNKKLVLASAGLLVTSAVLKAIAARRVELEAEEVVETSDDVSVDA